MNIKTKIITQKQAAWVLWTTSGLASAAVHLLVGLTLQGHSIGTSSSPIIDIEIHDQHPATAPSGGHASGPVLLANEGSADHIKHGAEARFLHGLATEEFVEDNYLGTFFWQGATVTIHRDAHGHLWLHDVTHGFHRRLHRFNRFIYVYGPDDEHPEPVRGSVTFFSDGERIFQFLWQEGGKRMQAPRR